MIKCLAIDDEPLALQQLASYVRSVPFLQLEGTCLSALEAREMINSRRIDAIFIDINMPDISGVDFVRSLAAPPMVVFTTAYTDYAMEGYRLNAVDYLLKPFGLDEFSRAAMKLKRIYDLQMQALHTAQPGPCAQDGAVAQAAQDAAQPPADTLFLKTDHRVVQVCVADIKYVEGMSEYLKVYVEGQRPIVVLLSMKRIEERLPAQMFMRIHRSYIVNLKKIQEVNKNRVIIDADTYLPIGDNFRERISAYVSARYLR